MPRFVLLYHRYPPNCARPSHWDLMLESGDMLRTWALCKLPLDWHAAHTLSLRDGDCPPLATSNDVEALKLADHRRAYLEYEGGISGDRGSVFRVAEGIYCVEGESDDCINCKVESTSLEGSLSLNRESPQSDRWTLKCNVSNGEAG